MTLLHILVLMITHNFLYCKNLTIVKICFSHLYVYISGYLGVDSVMFFYQLALYVFASSVTNKLPNKPLRTEQFQKVLKKNNIVPDADSANRLYYLLVDKQPGEVEEIYTL